MIDCSPFHDDEFPPKAAADEFDDELLFDSEASMAFHNHLVAEMNQDFSEFTIKKDESQKLQKLGDTNTNSDDSINITCSSQEEPAAFSPATSTTSTQLLLL